MPFAIFGTRLKENYSQLSDLSPEQPSIKGANMVQRYFPTGELAPASVLILHPGLNFRSEEGRSAVDKVSRSIAALPNIAEVRSISQPLGKPAGANMTLQERAAEVLGRPLIAKRLRGDRAGQPRG